MLENPHLISFSNNAQTSPYWLVMELESVVRNSPAETTIQSVVPTPNLGSKSELGPASVPTESLTDRGKEGTSTSLTCEQKNRARVQFLALCWTLFLAGWNDGTTGPLLPRIQLVYEVRPCLKNPDDMLGDAMVDVHRLASQ